MKKLFFSVIALCIGISTNIYAQSEPHEGGLFENYGVALKVGTYGIGVDLSTSLHPNIKARLGFNYFGFNLDSGLSFSETSIYGNDIDIDVINAKLRFPNVNLLVDYFPWKSSIFHITAGLYFGQNKVEAFGNVNPAEPFNVEGYIVEPDANGDFNARLKLGNVVKPYFGLGLGRTITKHRVGCKFELGLVYQGKLKLESDNVNEDLSSEMNRIDELDIPKFLTQIWPIMNFSISYRIK